MKENDNSKIDQLLDLLLDALQERQAARESERSDIPRPQAQESLDVQAPEPAPSTVTTELVALPEDQPADIESIEETIPETAEETIPPSYIPEKLPAIHLDRMLGRLALFIFVLIIIMNIPFNRYGTNLARAMPDEQSLVVRDGLVLKGSGEEIYVLEDNHKRWISSLEAFEYYGYQWEQVNLVNDAYLDRFPDGPPLSVLRKCTDSPHVFAIENGVKRWIKDIPTFEAQGYVWEDVQIISCSALRRIPDGPPIPPDAGEPPVP